MRETNNIIFDIMVGQNYHHAVIQFAFKGIIYPQKLQKSINLILKKGYKIPENFIYTKIHHVSKDYNRKHMFLSNYYNKFYIYAAEIFIFQDNITSLLISFHHSIIDGSLSENMLFDIAKYYNTNQFPNINSIKIGPKEYFNLSTQIIPFYVYNNTHAIRLPICHFLHKSFKPFEISFDLLNKIRNLPNFETFSKYTIMTSIFVYFFMISCSKYHMIIGHSVCYRKDNSWGTHSGAKIFNLHINSNKGIKDTIYSICSSTANCIKNGTMLYQGYPWDLHFSSWNNYSFVKFGNATLIDSCAILEPNKRAITAYTYPINESTYVIDFQHPLTNTPNWKKLISKIKSEIEIP